MKMSKQRPQRPRLGALTALLLAAGAQAAPVDELYAELYGYDAQGLPPQPASPDPLQRYTWDASVNVTFMQRYEQRAVAAVATPASSVVGAEALLVAGGNATFAGFGSLRLDFSTNHAGWVEILSPDLAAVLASGAGVTVKLSLSEYSEPWQGKTLEPVAYDGGVFRLETNTPEIYEGVRFAWVIYEDAGLTLPTPPTWTLAGARVVAQVKPVNYTAAFDSSDATLAAAWHAGAYGSRLNMHEHYFGSILMDRGDRTSIQGDGHPTMAAALGKYNKPRPLARPPDRPTARPPAHF